MSHRTVSDIPDLTGKVIIITGGNSGLGYESAKQLVQHGAEVVIACRDMVKAQEAINKTQQMWSKMIVLIQKKGKWLMQNNLDKSDKNPRNTGKRFGKIR